MPELTKRIVETLVFHFKNVNIPYGLRYVRLRTADPAGPQTSPIPKNALHRGNTEHCAPRAHTDPGTC